MNGKIFLVGVAGVLLGLSSLPGRATTIVVETGPFREARTAARAEAAVNWLDADRSDDAACTEAFAALELQRVLRRMTGRTNDFAVVGADALPPGEVLALGRAVFRLGLADADAAAPERADREAYWLRARDRDGRRIVLIYGATRVGTLYGVYDFLHRLGCRWFAPGAEEEIIPRRALASLPAPRAAETPAFHTRGFHAWENRGDPDFLLWMARNRLNYWCVEQEPHALLHKLGIQMSCGSHDAQARFLNPTAPYPYDHPRFTGDENRPPDPYAVGRLYQGDVNGDGTLSCFEAHPEWFAEVNGRRIPGIRGEFGVNYCTSNEDATTEFMKHFVECLATGEWKDAGVVRFWTLDGGKWCQCARCAALGSRTDRNLLLVNRLAREIKRARAAGRINRPLIIRFLAYADVLEPPTRPLPPDFDYAMCSATFFPICRCYVHEFDDPTCARNARYVKNLHGWAEDPHRHYRGQICLGEYYNVSGYKCLPLCFMHTMAHDIPYYYEHGARHFHYMHCTTKNWGNKALTNYQMARQLWNPRTDCEALWTDYFATRYGPVAKEMRRFYETLEKMLANVTELKYGLARRLNRSGKNLFPTPHLQYPARHYDHDDGTDLVEMLAAAATGRWIINAVQARPLPPAVARRVAEDERLFTYGERTLRFYDAACRAWSALAANHEARARADYREVVRLADLLRQDTTSTRWASSHANAPNAFEASRATGVLSLLKHALEKRATTPP